MIKNKLIMITALMLLPFSAMADGWLTSGIAGMNKEIEQTNFIVGGNCSGTLIDVERRWVLTNNHCVTRYVTHRTYQEPDANGVVTDVVYEEYKPIEMSQKTYVEHDLVSESAWVGELIGYDAKVDLALIQLRVDFIPHTMAAVMYNGDTPVMRGETVFSVGNPLGLDLSVSKGIVSNVNRTIQVGREQLPYYQVDAGIDPGNSGGALYNEDGQLIGVPAAGARGTSVGLAIPYTKIVEFLETFEVDTEVEVETEEVE